MEIQTACCFTGHRPERLPFRYEEQHPDCLRLKELLRQEIVRLIVEEGVTRFITGMALGIDQICAELVLELKETYPQVTLECAIPYEEQAAKWTIPQRDRYFDIIVRSDTASQLQGTYSRDCMKRRNRYMVEKAAMCWRYGTARPAAEPGRPSAMPENWAGRWPSSTR